MINLPGGCRSSNFLVHPKNWNSKGAKTTSVWYISYRFYDPTFPKPKLIVLKGMNHLRSLSDRQNSTKEILDKELDKLLNNAYNPLKNQFDGFKPQSQLWKCSSGDKTTPIDQLSPMTPIKPALDFAFKNVSVSERTRRDLKFMLADIKKAVDVLKVDGYEISKVSRKVIKVILEQASSSNDRFNKNRSYLMILFSELCEFEAVEINPVRDIKKKKILKRIREVLTIEERTLVNNYLLLNYPEFHRFLHIFFHSGARISQLLRIKKSAIDIENQRYKLVIQKGREHKEVYKTIKNIALPYWLTQLEGSQKDVIFSKGLKPGLVQIKPYQITKRWYRLVKMKLGIKSDFYALKHLHSTEITELLSEKEAAQHNDHTSTAMIVGIYDVKRENRLNSTIQKVNNKFA